MASLDVRTDLRVSWVRLASSRTRDNPAARARTSEHLSRPATYPRDQDGKRRPFRTSAHARDGCTRAGRTLASCSSFCRSISAAAAGAGPSGRGFESLQRPKHTHTTLLNISVWTSGGGRGGSGGRWRRRSRQSVSCVSAGGGRISVSSELCDQASLRVVRRFACLRVKICAHVRSIGRATVTHCAPVASAVGQHPPRPPADIWLLGPELQ